MIFDFRSFVMIFLFRSPRAVKPMPIRFNIEIVSFEDENLLTLVQLEPVLISWRFKSIWLIWNEGQVPYVNSKHYASP